MGAGRGGVGVRVVGEAVKRYQASALGDAGKDARGPMVG
mgnify:FL=1